ncbi:MAG: DUF4097 family beta strand repeat protein [Gemmatimonadetes bacterium]|nr:DUF4097 family beta strand repeat protein [Gemmatimonadota bacterium]
MRNALFGLVLLAGSAVTPAPVLSPAGQAPVPLPRIIALRPQGAQQGVDFQWKGRLAPGKTIEVRGVNGDVRAVLATGPEVEVTAVKRARRSDPDEVDIRVIEHPDGVTICAIYPTSRRARRENYCGPGESHNNTENNDVKVEFTVRVPAGVRLAGATVNGDVMVESLRSDVLATTVNGSVEVSTTGYAEAETVNGSIRAAMQSTKLPNRLDFRTVNGGITLDLPEGFSAEVEAQTVNGDVSTDFPLTVQGRFGPRRVTGRIGAGGPRLSLQTVNGSIRLRRAM